jgi:hypothetical protein
MPEPKTWHPGIALVIYTHCARFVLCSTSPPNGKDDIARTLSLSVAPFTLHPTYVWFRWAETLDLTKIGDHMGDLSAADWQSVQTQYLNLFNARLL